MNKFYLRSLLWIAVTTSFLLSCSKVEKDQIKPTSTKPTNATARIDGVLYDQFPLQPPLNGLSVTAYSDLVYTDDFVVPVGETWKLEKIICYTRVPTNTRTVSPIGITNEFVTVTIHADNEGKPGDILHTFKNPPSVVLQETLVYSAILELTQLDIEDTELAKGTYWLGFATEGEEQGFSLYYHTPAVGLPATLITKPSGVLFPFNRALDFKLLGSLERTETTIENVLTTFNANVTAGTITGTSPGKSAANRVNAFKNMLNNAKALLAANDLAGACTQLTDAQKRIHTGGKVRPDHFITGSSAGALHELITELKTDLGCL